MGILVQGRWREEELPTETDSAGAFQRSASQFRNRITADGTSGFKAEPGRYHLYVAYNCPWAHRALIFRTVKKLEDAITVATLSQAFASRAGCRSGLLAGARSLLRTTLRKTPQFMPCGGLWTTVFELRQFMNCRSSL